MTTLLYIVLFILLILYYSTSFSRYKELNHKSQAMKLSNFFIWCAGSDTALLSHCPQNERNKHIGFGTLVLVPAILAFVSMSFALSTINGIEDKTVLHFIGGIVWGLIIFSFDRFIVSTHRRKMDNKSEFNSPAFFLRLLFALILGIVISHPLVMLYFDGSVKDQIKENVVAEKAQIQEKYDVRIAQLTNRNLYLDSLSQVKESARNAQEQVVAKEIDGEVIKNAKGEIVTTGLYGKGPSAENKIKHLGNLQAELAQLRVTHQTEKNKNQAEIEKLKHQQDSTIQAYAVSYDYLKRELALEQLKEKNSIVSTTQYFLILLFILVDILPFIFKTFSPFGMYDRILFDDSVLLKDLDDAERKVYLQKLYGEISRV